MESASSANELRCLLALKLIKGIGNAIAFKLLEQFSSAQALFQNDKKSLVEKGVCEGFASQISEFNWQLIPPILQWAAQENRDIIPFNSPLYPPQLAQINTPPLILFVIGNPELLHHQQLAIIGSRNPTTQGITNTQNLAQALVEQNITITSGLALGVDGEAHRTALKHRGYTVAVAGTGLNRVYPAMHRELAHQIALNGVLVSEKFPDDPIDQGSFPQRNRIIAGLSCGTLVIEATVKSGSLITARHAMEEGREVFAVPGSIHNLNAKGCHRLIKQGAKLVESVQDILEELPEMITSPRVKVESDSKPPLDQELQAFYELIEHEITSVDALVLRSQLTVEAVTNKLLQLELLGWIVNTTGGYIRR